MPIAARCAGVQDPAQHRRIAAFRADHGERAFARYHVQSDAEIDAFIRQTLDTVYHPVGTCRMGKDENAVVGLDFRVRGVDGLRVVDASVFPDLTGGNINAVVMMVAEKASDVIRCRTPLPAEEAA